jgi:peroxin-11B
MESLLTTFATVGRDKALRLIQYFSRFYAWYLYRTNNPNSAILPFDVLKKQLGLVRKVLRVGKFVEHFKAAAQASDAKGMDPVLKYCAVGRQLGYAGYMVCDNLTVVCIGLPQFLVKNAWGALYEENTI